MTNIDELAEMLEQGMGDASPATYEEALEVATAARARVFHRYGDRITKATELQALATCVSHRILRESEARAVVMMVVDAVEIAYRLGREYEEARGGAG